MATNPYITQVNIKSEQNLINDFFREIIQMRGQDFLYIPRETVNDDDLFGESIASKFTHAYPLEMMIENTDSYDGGDVFAKLGLEIRDEATVIISRNRFFEVIANTPHKDLKRPREKDLVFIPFSNSLFEITFVEHESPFYMLNALPAFKLSISLFEMQGEKVDVDVVGLDLPSPEQTRGQGVEAENYLQKLSMASTGNWKLGETISGTTSTGITISGEIVKIEDNGQTLYMAHISHDDSSDTYHPFAATMTVTGSISAVSGTINSVSDVPQDFGANDTIETLASGVLDTTQSNPFGDV